MTKQRWVWSIGAVAAIVLIATTGWLLFWTPANQMVRGVFIGPIAVGGMKVPEARAKVEALLADLPVTLNLSTTAGNQLVNRTDLVAGFDLERSLAEALAVGHDQGLWQDIQVQWHLRKSSVTIPLYPRLSAAGLESLHLRLTELFGLPSRAASFSVRGDSVTILPSQNGRAVDRRELERAITTALEKLESRIEVPLQEIKASPSTEELTAMGIKEKMTEFSSTFTLGLAGRVHNIKAAAKAIDGRIVAPGEIFSFNDVVGPADAKDGYQDAVVISNGEYTTGVGGGVCQVSSTLYGAVLRADLKITERHNHSLIVAYVPPALDATVNYPVHDFRFENTTPHHIMIKTETVGDKVIVRLYGQRDQTTQVKIESQVLETYPNTTRLIPDDTLPLGQEEVVQNGSVGYLATAYRKVYKDGVMIRSEKLSQDYYSPSTKVVRTGTKPPPTTADPQNTVKDPTPAKPIEVPQGPPVTPTDLPPINPAQGEKIPNPGLA